MLKNIWNRFLVWRERRAPHPGEIWEEKSEWPDQRIRRWRVVTRVSKNKVRWSILKLDENQRLRVCGDQTSERWRFVLLMYKTTARMDLATGHVTDPEHLLTPPAVSSPLPWSTP